MSSVEERSPGIDEGLRADLASLRIERKSSFGSSAKNRAKPSSRTRTPNPRPGGEPGVAPDSTVTVEEFAAPSPGGRRSIGRGRPRRRGWGIRLLTLMLWMVPLAMVGAGGSYVYREYEKNRPKHVVSVAIAQRMTPAEAEKLLSAKGYIEARHQAMVGSMMPGRVEAVLVNEGDQVEKDQLIAVLEHRELDASLQSRRVMVQQRRAELREAEANLKDRIRRENLARQLLARRSASVDEVDEAATQTEIARARVEALTASIEAAEAMIKEIEASIRNMEIRAPFGGTILTKEAEVGETITPGGMGAASGRGSVVGLADLRDLEIEVDVPESLLGRLEKGQPAEISVAAVPDRRYRGRLRQIIQMGDRTRGTIKVKVEILDEDEKLFPELVATVHFLPRKDRDPALESKPEVFAPRSAIVEEAGLSHVWIVDADMKARKRPIEVVMSNNDPVRIDSGLQGGERVILSPPEGLAEGQLVRIAE